MIRRLLPLVLLLAACSGEVVPSTTIPVPAVTTSVTVEQSTTTATFGESVEACDDVPYRPLLVPERASGGETEPSDLGSDTYTTIAGTALKLWVDAEAAPVMAIIRGSLPPEPWAGPTAQIELLRQDAALGPLSDGLWAVAWFESEERCDLYTLVLYPPTSADEALAVAESLIPDR